MFDPVTLLWAVVGVGITTVVVVRAWSRHRAPRDSSLGTVSDQWLAEHRLNRPDSQR